MKRCEGCMGEGSQCGKDAYWGYEEDTMKEFRRCVFLMV